MGKGDQRSRKGKIARGTTGKRRPKKTTKVPVLSKETTSTKAAPKKASKKKSA